MMSEEMSASIFAELPTTQNGKLCIWQCRQANTHLNPIRKWSSRWSPVSWCVRSVSGSSLRTPSPPARSAGLRCFASGVASQTWQTSTRRLPSWPLRHPRRALSRKPRCPPCPPRELLFNYSEARNHAACCRDAKLDFFFVQNVVRWVSDVEARTQQQ